ncbi:aromatase/cyclase [Streptosporangiaceae bacterium NEAU-GS5]|nr:aromatase/cyclase [Streptosporangiaceae bacterium NEAU-GS5]
MATAHHTEHDIVVGVPARTIYHLLADVSRWPQYFSPTVHAEVLESSGDTERIQLWATANDTVKTWISRRRLDEAARVIEFTQEVTQPPAQTLRGMWRLTEVEGGGTKVSFTHDYTVIDDDPDGARWLAEVIDTNSRTELANLKRIAETLADAELAPFAFADTVTIDAGPEAVYDFLNDAAAWPERLPHVARLVLTEETPGLQWMEMDTQAPDGTKSTTTSIRICRPSDRIIYKQVKLPAVMSAHTGEWLIEPNGDGGVTVTGRHTVCLDRAGVAALLGADTTIAAAQQKVRQALGGNSLTTLRHAKRFAEARTVGAR